MATEHDRALPLRQRQREAAVAKGRRMIQDMSQMKQRLWTGEVNPVKLAAGEYEEYEPMLAEWKVERFLKLMPYIGDHYRFEILVTAKLPPRMPLGTLSAARRRQLAELIEQVPKIMENHKRWAAGHSGR